MKEVMDAPLPPGPKANVLLTSRKELQYDVLNLLLKNVQNFPGISRMRIGPYYFVNVSDPASIEQVFTDGTHFVKGRENHKMKFLLGNGLLTNDGKFWLKQRRLIQPLFHKQRLEGFVQTIMACGERMMREWATGNKAVLDIHGEMTRVTLGIVSQTLMSTDVSGEFRNVSDALGVLMKGLTARGRSFITLPYWVPSPQNIRMKTNRQVLNDTIYRVIQERRSSSEKFDDLLTMLLEVEDADSGERMSDEQIRDEVLTIFLAGHETTANALSFTFYLLAQHPEAHLKIAEEVGRVIGDGDLTFEKLNRLDYTTRVLKESMRLYPPAWGILREAAMDCTLNGYLIKKGDAIVLAPYAVHRWDKYWPEPEKFDPDRFLPERVKNMHRYTYFPFGGGARLCIGNNFAMMEMQILLAQVCRQFEFSIIPKTKLELEALVTLRPKGELYLGVRKS